MERPHWIGCLCLFSLALPTLHTTVHTTSTVIWKVVLCSVYSELFSLVISVGLVSTQHIGIYLDFHALVQHIANLHMTRASLAQLLLKLPSTTKISTLFYWNRKQNLLFYLIRMGFLPWSTCFRSDSSAIVTITWVRIHQAHSSEHWWQCLL